MKQLCFLVQTSLWRLLPLIPFPHLGPDSAPTETSWIFPFVVLWTSCSWKPAMPMGACLPEFNLVQSCSCTVHCYSHTITVPPQLKGISLKNPNLGNFWGWFCSGVINDMRTTCAWVLVQPGCLGSCRGIHWKHCSHWHCPERFTHGSEAGFCTDSAWGGWPWSPLLTFCELPARSSDSCWSPEQSS